jgi:hypothetical protein
LNWRIALVRSFIDPSTTVLMSALLSFESLPESTLIFWIVCREFAMDACVSFVI